MIPQTVGALIGFLIFIAPGVLWELLRERHRPPLDGSTFREAARVALMSVVLSGLAIGVLAGVHALASDVFFDPGAWLREGRRYVDDHYGRIVVTIGAEVALACLFAWAPWRWPAPFAWAVKKLVLTRSKSGVVNVAEPVLWSVLFGDAAGEPETTTKPEDLTTMVLARHADGHFYIGKFLAVDYTLGREDAHIALQRPLRVRYPGASKSEEMPPHFARLVLPLAELSDLWIAREEPPSGESPISSGP